MSTFHIWEKIIYKIADESKINEIIMEYFWINDLVIKDIYEWLINFFYRIDKTWKFEKDLKIFLNDQWDFLLDKILTGYSLDDNNLYELYLKKLWLKKNVMEDKWCFIFYRSIFQNEKIKEVYDSISYLHKKFWKLRSEIIGILKNELWNEMINTLRSEVIYNFQKEFPDLTKKEIETIYSYIVETLLENEIIKRSKWLIIWKIDYITEKQYWIKYTEIINNFAQKIDEFKNLNYIQIFEEKYEKNYWNTINGFLNKNKKYLNKLNKEIWKILELDKELSKQIETKVWKNYKILLKYFEKDLDFYFLLKFLQKFLKFSFSLLNNLYKLKENKLTNEKIEKIKKYFNWKDITKEDIEKYIFFNLWNFIMKFKWIYKDKFLQIDFLEDYSDIEKLNLNTNNKEVIKEFLLKIKNDLEKINMLFSLIKNEKIRIILDLEYENKEIFLKDKLWYDLNKNIWMDFFQLLIDEISNIWVWNYFFNILDWLKELKIKQIKKYFDIKDLIKKMEYVNYFYSFPEFQRNSFTDMFKYYQIMYLYKALSKNMKL